MGQLTSNLCSPTHAADLQQPPLRRRLPLVGRRPGAHVHRSVGFGTPGCQNVYILAAVN
jgi:hypothetical protein